MKSCGLIIRYMSRQDWKGEKFLIKLRTVFFNLCLLIYQLVLIIVGTVYGKFKWPKASLAVRILSIAGVVNGLVFIWYTIFISHFYWLLPIWVFSIPYFVATCRGIDWRKTWRAAKASHMRLVLKSSFNQGIETWDTANFGYPKMEIQPWRASWNDGKYLEYRKPTFDPSPQFIAAMIQYAHDQEGKRYDDYQLISNALHLVAWIVMPWCWGKEIRIIKALNRKGGCEHCISGVTACLRWGEKPFQDQCADRVREIYRDDLNFTGGVIVTSRFFEIYHTATTSPCLVPLSENWEVT